MASIWQIEFYLVFMFTGKFIGKCKLILFSMCYVWTFLVLVRGVLITYLQWMWQLTLSLCSYVCYACVWYVVVRSGAFPVFVSEQSPAEYSWSCLPRALHRVYCWWSAQAHCPCPRNVLYYSMYFTCHLRFQCSYFSSMCIFFGIRSL